MVRPFGQILIESGMISKKDLSRALNIQKSTDKRIGEILTDMGAIKSEDLKLALGFRDKPYLMHFGSLIHNGSTDFYDLISW